MGNFQFSIDGLPQFERLLAQAPKATRRAAALALNYGARRARTESAREISRQVNLPKGYVAENLRITQRANEGSLRAVITGRRRATSLRRFGARKLARRGISVAVHPGRRKKIRRAFFLSLRSGNVGVAIRLKPGEEVTGKTGPAMKYFNVAAKNAHTAGRSALALLYGPSVDQVFTDVRQQVAPEIAREMANEFHRQFARLLGGQP